MWFPTTPSELSYVDSAPQRIANVVTIDATPERVFDLFATGERQEEWFQDFVACRWTSPEPHTVGTTREVQLKTLTVKERFLAWDRGQRLAFSIDGITLPIVKQMLEDLRFEPLDGGRRTRLVWHVFYTPALVMVPVHGAARAVFSHMFRRSAEKLQRFAEHNP
ncbi:SRPBCC family protein [Polyangium jinanense]|uniref:SRPBCC family protein n=1 Tax=Polyangium jinanense TaxID=2829994 RepID=A0A9X3X662_9BACT|nr:SRPBCC family protein [Polyangium jinanense]MDC3956031.1 SRPBCC family protein [Polyangium jinanense]MDC3982938.1 SRPBCC family protein [Polyangium jinanense]